ncbi:hypothetical protein VBS44_24855 [Klebsiella pneumoniae]|nr:hypothetical protein [Klebsiella pneumoniae]
MSSVSYIVPLVTIIPHKQQFACFSAISASMLIFSSGDPKTPKVGSGTDAGINDGAGFDMKKVKYVEASTSDERNFDLAVRACRADEWFSIKKRASIAADTPHKPYL